MLHLLNFGERNLLKKRALSLLLYVCSNQTDEKI